MHEAPDTVAERAPGRSRWRRWGAVVALTVGVTVVSSVTTSVVWATHDFPDVPTSSPHHGDISWAVDNGITQGFGDGTFRPTQSVSRQTMATFMRRLAAEFEIVSSSAPAGTGTEANHSTACPAGKRPLAGGGTSSAFNLFMTDSSPFNNLWSIRWETDNNVAIGGGNTVTVYVLCAPGL
jgi:hypothetical protein